MRIIEIDMTKINKADIQGAIVEDYNSKLKKKDLGNGIFLTPNKIRSWDVTIPQDIDLLNIPDNIMKIIRKQRELNIKDYLRQAKAMKTKADFVIFDHKRYKTILNNIDDITPCQFINDVKDIITKVTKGTAHYNYKYKVRNRDFSKVEC